MFKIWQLSVWLILFLLYSLSLASFENKEQGCESLSSGSGGTASLNSAFAVFNNPSKIGLNEKADINLFYKNYYGLGEINQISLANHFHIGTLPLGLGISTFGNKLYRETEIRAGAAIEIVRQVRLGITLNLYQLEIKNYGSAISWGFDLALMKHVSENISMAFVISNLNEPKIGSASERIPAHFCFGMAYQPLNTIGMSLDIVKDDQFNFDYRFGFQYNANRWFSIMCGFRDLVNTVSAGLKISNNEYNLNYACQYHPELGLSNSMSIGYAF